MNLLQPKARVLFFLSSYFDLAKRIFFTVCVFMNRQKSARTLLLFFVLCITLNSNCNNNHNRALVNHSNLQLPGRPNSEKKLIFVALYTAATRLVKIFSSAALPFNNCYNNNNCVQFSKKIIIIRTCEEEEYSLPTLSIQFPAESDNYQQHSCKVTKHGAFHVKTEFLIK